VIGGARERTVLALLLLRANRVVPFDELVDALWPDQPPATARQQVQSAIWQLRRALDDTARPAAERRILTSPPGYLIRVHAGELDADTFESSLAAGDLRAALAVWQGPALAEFDAPSVRAGATALDEQRISAVEDLAELDLLAGRCQDVVSQVVRFTDVYPYRERLRASLMVGLYRLGRQADALFCYREYRTLLAAELGVEPGPRLRAIEQAILRADPALRHSTLTDPALRHSGSTRPALRLRVDRPAVFPSVALPHVAAAAGVPVRHRAVVSAVGPDPFGKHVVDDA
jgi:DNA-binding SARP family transcriptional activator